MGGCALISKLNVATGRQMTAGKNDGHVHHLPTNAFVINVAPGSISMDKLGSKNEFVFSWCLTAVSDDIIKLRRTLFKH